MNGRGIKNLRIGIVGASMAGLSLAWGLRRYGIETTLYERSSGLHAHQGAGVTLTPWLVQTLELDGLRHISRYLYLGNSGKILWDQQVDKYAAGWGDIYGVLRRRIDGTALFEHCPVQRVETRPPRICIDGRDEEAFDLVAGADGIGSLVRTKLDPDFLPHYLGYVAVRGLVPRTRLPDRLPATIASLFGNAMAKVIMDGEHATLYGLPGDDEPLNWMWYANFPESALVRLLTDRDGDTHRWSIPSGKLRHDIEAELRALGADRLPPWLAALMEATEELFLQPIFYGVANPVVGSGLALVGDAAHLAVPHIGGGVTLAVQDSLTLAETIAGSGNNFESQLPAWAESRRSINTAHLAFAARLGKSLQSTGKPWELWRHEDFDRWWDTLQPRAPEGKSC